MRNPAMTFSSLPESQQDLVHRMARDLADSYDEEFEFEMEDRDFSDGGAPAANDPDARRTYFRELFRLHGELVELQEWVQHSKQKVVILFEGRDAAGKGG